MAFNRQKLDGKKVAGIAIAVAAVILIIVLVSLSRQNSSSSGTSPEQASGNSPEPQKFATREAPPTDIVVPDKNSENLQENIAKPAVVASANSTNDSSYRSFDIKISNDAFTPDTVIVNQGDTANINVTAVDKNYDFNQPDYGFNVMIKKGETKKIQFGATAAGKFIFYCVSCGGPEKGPQGYIIVASKD